MKYVVSYFVSNREAVASIVILDRRIDVDLVFFEVDTTQNIGITE